MKILAIPLELSAANEFVAKLHRHHAPVYRDKFRVGAVVDGKLVGGCSSRQTCFSKS